MPGPPGPGTAAERGLADPFDPEQAIPKAADLLADLRARFGNLGLAAAGYNAGPQRVADWLAGKGGMPAETRNYVLIVTGLDVEDWRSGAAAKPYSGSSESCEKITVALKRRGGTLIAAVKSRPKFSAFSAIKTRRPTSSTWSTVVR